ncbi:MAG: flavodoxin family protein [Lentisphaerae bacterium]|nr:flavodoxin family protein [Lentisphaerota bacterium]
MSKKILIIASSPRRNGNSEMLCDAFIAGAQAAGNQVEKVTLAGKKINFCTACYACHKGECVHKDDAPEIARKMLAADVIVLATPVYFYTMCAQLKALIDRTVMVYPQIQNKDFYYLMTMAETDETMFKGTIEALRGFAACCENSRECGIVAVPGVYESGAIAGNPALETARKMGAAIQ